MNTISEWFQDDDSDTPHEVTPMYLTDLDDDRAIYVVGTWLIAVVGRYSGATIHQSLRPHSPLIRYDVTYEGRSVAGLVVHGSAVRQLG